ncbi:Pyrophosphoryl-undecaprenol N-acetylglucosamine transferase [Dissostichus eleginoides]|uniref:Pyrophosphoryl-undecaprenol N-acetylglucosamine transferase n=1 Tax=Dissostichus eleginoides TaxID=100907 RepID=A0AAD9F181_DISEL|nr:Pyrophosphoryl-undecaprenol N-acetylglucosamine transferase [Dissostichus eleginoides]
MSVLFAAVLLLCCRYNATGTQDHSDHGYQSQGSEVTEGLLQGHTDFGGDYHLGAHIAKSLRQRNIQIVFTVRKELSHTHEERETGCPHLNLTLVFQAGVLATVLPTPASSAADAGCGSVAAMETTHQHPQEFACYQKKLEQRRGKKGFSTAYRWLLMTLLGVLNKVILIIAMPPPIQESLGRHACSFSN